MRVSVTFVELDRVGAVPHSRQMTDRTDFLDSSATTTWAPTVHVRALAEQDAHAGRHYDGLQEVDRARAGPRGLAEAHLSNGAVPPPGHSAEERDARAPGTILYVF